MKLRKLFALLMAAVMLLGMMPVAHAVLIDCNHDWDSGKWINGAPANCRDWKTKRYTCAICGAIDDCREVGACVPGPKTWIRPQGSNCQEFGTWEITCKFCGEWLEGMEEPGPHKWSEKIVEQPWCDVGGMKAVICSVCGEWQNNGTPLNPLGHNWGSWSWANGSAPSCTEGASQVRECQRCGQMEDRYVPGGDHKFGEWITTVEPTCTERGRHHHKCTVCGYSEWEPIPTVDHIWGEWHVIEEPQVGIPGTERRACTFGCGLHEDREIPALEEMLSAEGLKLTLVLTSTPANGEYFVVGEQVVFTENWVNNTGKELYPFDVSIWTYPTPEYPGVPDIMCSWDAEETGPVTPGQSGSHQLVTTVTEADVARGAIYAMAIITSAENNGADLADVTTPFVTAPCAPVAGSDYATSIKLEVLDIPSVTAEWAGDVYTAKVKVTNTGDTTISLYAHQFSDSNNEHYPNAILYDWNKYQDTPRGDWLPAGASLTTDLEFAVTQDGIKAGELRFNLVQYAAPWYAQVGDQYTDTPADVVPAPEGTTGYYSKTDAVVSDTVEIVVPINQGTAEFDPEGLTVTKTASAGDYSNPCKPGDEVTFTITVTNNTGVELLDVEITDPIKGGNEDAVVDIIPSMQPGESVTASFSYTVTEEDATVGVEGFENTAYASGYTADGTQVSGTSETIFVCCVIEHGLTFFKSIANVPANGEYFVVGETIEFSITVTNNTGYELAGMIITDALDVDWICEPNELLLPGESRTETFSYVVTELDAAAGSVANYATVRIIEADGYHFFTSNVVTAPCSPSGADGDMEYPVYNGCVTENPFGVITALEVTKEVESLPLNGLYYTEGETVAYRITYVNSGETLLTDVMIYDSLAGMTEIASAEMLDVGESRFCVFHHTVTAEDVARGYVSNTAIGQFEIDGYLNTVHSDTVVVDTDGQPDPEIPEGILPPGGVIDISKMNLDQCCRRVTSSRTNVSYSWGTSFCSDHANIQGSILMMEKAAATPAMQMQTAAYAVALWRAEVDKLYEELLGAADPQARAVIMAEYVSFLTHASNYETMLKVVYPDQPLVVAQKMAALWEEKCITLCQEMHMPAAARQDSFLAVEVATMEGISDACTCVTSDEGKGWNNFEQNYCPTHSFPFMMIDMLLAGQDTAEAWTTVRQIWNVELRSAYNKMIALLGENSDVALAEYATLESWMIAREAELTLLYPDNPELVAQTMVRIVIDQVNALCQLAQ